MIVFLCLSALAFAGFAGATSSNSALQTNFIVCIGNGNGNVRVVNAQQPCRQGEQRSTWHVGQPKTGLTGDTGAPGAQGAAGPQGAKGDQGNTGSKGDTGNTGAAGSKGDTGNTGAAGPQGDPGTNGADAGLVVVTNVSGPDSSTCGGSWANDTYTRKLQFVPQDDGTIHVIRTYQGTFTTIAGVPGPIGPCDGSQVGGVTGTFTGYDVVVVTGGHFFPEATCAANCSSDAMMAAFFPGGERAINSGWEYHYDAGDNGLWINADAISRGGNSGNITG